MMIYLPGLPLWPGLAIAFAARNTALYFANWYPRYRRAKLAASCGVLVRFLNDAAKIQPSQPFDHTQEARR
jgi:hypothetical protein